MNSMKHLAHIIYRFVILWIVDVISLLATAWIIPGISINPVDSRSVLVVAVSAAFLLGIVAGSVISIELVSTYGWHPGFTRSFTTVPLAVAVSLIGIQSRRSRKKSQIANER